MSKHKIRMKLLDAFYEAAIDAHAGWLLWDSTRTQPSVGRWHAKEFSDCPVKQCTERRRVMLDVLAEMDGKPWLADALEGKF